MKKTNRPQLNAILLVAFGTNSPQTQQLFDSICKKIKNAFHNTEVRWAYTSKPIRDKLLKQGITIDSPEIALAKMADQGFTNVIVHSMNLIAGYEYHELFNNSLIFSKMINGFDKIRITKPLLSDPDDFQYLADALIKAVPEERKPHEAVIFMGHGTNHPSNASYESMMYRFQKADQNMFVGTMGKTLTIHEIVQTLIKKRIEKTYLIPLMFVAGNHVQKDMAGDNPNSWKSILVNAGIACVPIIKGLIEYDEIFNLWLKHLKLIVDIVDFVD